MYDLPPAIVVNIKLYLILDHAAAKPVAKAVAAALLLLR